MEEYIKPLRFGLLLALLSILAGFSLGGIFGGAEEAVKEILRNSGETVLATAYSGEVAKLDKAIQGAWRQLIRAHLHLGGIGTAAMAQILLLAFLRVRPAIKTACSLMLGGGALGYGCYWLLAGFTAPALGGVVQAKRNLFWLGQPSAGLCIAGTAAVLVLLARQAFRSAPASSGTGGG